MTRSLAELGLHGQITALPRNRTAEPGHLMICTIIRLTWNNWIVSMKQMLMQPLSYTNHILPMKTFFIYL